MTKIQTLTLYTIHFFASYCHPPVVDYKFYDFFMFFTRMTNALTQKEVWVPNIPSEKYSS